MRKSGLSSFRTRLLLGVLLPVFLIQCINIGYELFEHEQMFKRLLQRESQLISHLAVEALGRPLWDYDTRQVQDIVQGILNQGGVGQVEVFDTAGGMIASGRAPGFTPMGSDFLTSRSIVFAQGGGVEVLGQLRLVIPLSALSASLQESLVQHLLMSGAILLLIAVAVYLVLARQSQPLVALAGAITDLRLKRLEGRIPGLGRSDEIGLMAQALEQLRRNEREMSELRAQTDEDVRRAQKRVNRALQTIRDGVLLADETGEVVLCNKNAAAFFGGAHTGQPLEFQSWLAPDLAARFEQQVLARQPFSAETLVEHHSSGEPLNLLIRGGPISDEDGLFLGTALLATDHSEQARQAEQVKFLAEHDSLTGLPNRRLMETTLAHWLREENDQVTVLLADLDHFKQINDTLGHPAGDALLQVVARKFESCASTNVLAARLGGDEFAILAKGASGLKRITNIADSLLLELSQPLEIGGTVLHTGMSGGIATLAGNEAEPSEVIRRADMALYEAKRSGRGQVEVFHDTLETVIQRKTLLERELRAALEEGSLRPVFQVQTDLGTGQIIGFETLARWHHRQLGSISPAEFIPIAEEVGLIRELTYQMMTHAFTAAARWHSLGFSGRVAVNLSPKLFGSQVDEFVRDCLFATNCPASAVEAEITETVVLSSGQAALREIQALRNLGVTVALDDFGMGYSSLSYLQKFPVDKIKIDSAFVSKLPESEETRAIVVAIAELGHALGMKVTGEGAETERHRQLLKDCKVDYLQGYFDGPPLAERAASARLFPGSAPALRLQG